MKETEGNETSRRCGSCAWWEPGYSAWANVPESDEATVRVKILTSGECRGTLPSASDGWPVTSARDWCSRYEDGHAESLPAGFGGATRDMRARRSNANR